MENDSEVFLFFSFQLKIMIKRIGDIILIQLSEIDSNIYILGNTVIDSGTGFNFTRLHSILKAIKKSFDDFTLVVNTHGHFDHIGGNGYFLKAKLAIHEEDAPIIEKGDIKLSWADYFDGKLRPRKVDIKLKDGDIIEMGSRKLKIIHTPGHTAGSICLYDERDKILFTGDTLFSDGVGRTDLPGGDEEKMVESLEKISKLKVQKMLPGHGDPVLENAEKVIEDILTNPGDPEED